MQNVGDNKANTVQIHKRRMNITSIELEAIREETNNYRFYFLTISKDLFNYFVVTAIYGRIGSAGTRRMFAFPSIKEAQNKIQDILKRRRTSKKRIGVSYTVKEKHDPQGLLNVIYKPSNINRRC